MNMLTNSNPHLNANKKYSMLFVAYDKFPPFRVDVAVLFGKELSHRCLQIDYLLQSKEDNKNFNICEWSGSKAYVGATDNGSSIVNRFHKHLLDLFNDLRMIKFVKAQKYSCIQIKDKFLAAFIGLTIAKLTNCKFFFWLSYPFPESDIYEYQTCTARYPILYLVRGLIRSFSLYKIILPLADHIFVQSDQMKNDVISKGVSPGKITPVPMGIDIDDFRQLNQETFNDNAIVPNSIIYIGEMEKIRKIGFVLRAFKIVLDSFPEAKLFMVGGSSNDSDIDDLKQKAKNLRIDHAVTFTGMLPRSKALQYVKTSEIGLSPIAPNPIYIPSSPTKIIEYMLLGKPVVANDIPDQEKILRHSNAGYCTEYDEVAFAKSIIALLKNPEKARKMGNKGMEYVIRHRSYKVIADLVEKQYRKLLS
jgi:glycosyltransferase involved in cell wall biosynthesis